MAYPRFDDPSKKVSQAGRKINDATKMDALQRALMSISNRIVGTGGTAWGDQLASLGTGGTCGIKIGRAVKVIINGRFGTVATQDNLFLPNGTQGKSTYVKYLVSGGFGTQGTVTAGNEGTGSTTALLPDCPKDHVALGYMEYVTGTAGAFIRFGGGTAGGANVISGNAAATCGTVNAFQELVHMPLDED